MVKAVRVVAPSGLGWRPATVLLNFIIKIRGRLATGVDHRRVDQQRRWLVWFGLLVVLLIILVGCSLRRDDCATRVTAAKFLIDTTARGARDLLR